MRTAFIVLMVIIAQSIKAQNVGIGTTTPIARLHVADSNVVFTATGNIPITAGNPPVQGGGRRLVWYSDKAAFRAGYVSGSQWDKDNIGNYSVGMGTNTIASGPSSTAIGNNATASGDFSAAIGVNIIASGFASTAMGVNNGARGNRSTVLGSLNDADGDYSTAIGNNTTASGHFSTSMGTNTTASGTHSTAMGKYTNATGYASTAIGDSSLASGLMSFSSGFRTIAFGPYSTAMGINTAANGNASTAMGNGTNASGSTSTAIGYAAIASGNGSTALGNETNASGAGSTALGTETIASGDFSTSLGFSSVASGDYSTATGISTAATGLFTTAMGNNSRAYGTVSTAMGLSSQAWGYAGTVIGMYNDPISPVQTAPTATSPLFIIGNGNAFNLLSNAMVVLKNGNVGIGTDAPAANVHIRHAAGGGLILENANDNTKWRIYSASGDNNLTFYNTANAEVADIDDVTGTFNAISDSRVKKNIQSMKPVLPLLMNLHPSYYQFNWQQTTEQRQIGLLAQEAHKLFPELVSYNKEKDLYKMNYAGFSTVAIKAIQEQQQEIEELKGRIEKLETLLLKTK